MVDEDGVAGEHPSRLAVLGGLRSQHMVTHRLTLTPRAPRKKTTCPKSAGEEKEMVPRLLHPREEAGIVLPHEEVNGPLRPLEIRPGDVGELAIST